MRQIITFLLICVPISFVYSSDSIFVVRLKPGIISKNGKNLGKPLYPSDSRDKVEQREFFNNYRVFLENEKLPPSSNFVSIDTVRFLKINPVSLAPQGNNPLLPLIKIAPQKKVSIGIIDTGIDFEHPLLIENLFINEAEDINNNGRLDKADLNGMDEDGNGYIDDVSGYDFVDSPGQPDFGDYSEPDPWPMDQFPGGHGTAVAHAAILSSANTAAIVNLRAGNASGYLQEDDVAQAMYYAYQNGIKIINMSFGDTHISRFLMDLIEFLSQEGILFVASGGNNSSAVLHFPSSLSSVLSVGSFSLSGYRSGFSNYGCFIDLFAYGENLQLAALGGGQDQFSGTSFSAPVVSGGLAKIWAENPNANNFEISTYALLRCLDYGDRGWDYENSNGLFISGQSTEFSGQSRLRFIHPFSYSQFSDSFLLIFESVGFATGETKLYMFPSSAPDLQTLVSEKQKNGVDSVWIIPETDEEMTLRLSWYDDKMQRNIEVYQQIQKIARVPQLLSWELIPQLEKGNQIFLINARSDIPAKLRFKSNQVLIESTIADTSQYITLTPTFESNFSSNSFVLFNHAGTSLPVDLPELQFSSQLSGYLHQQKKDILNGEGYVWPTPLGQLLAALTIDESEGFSNLQLFDITSGQSVYSFDQPWIIRDVVRLSDEIFRFLLGFGEKSMIADYSIPENRILERWNFDGPWGVKFIGKEALFREEPRFYLYGESAGEWQKKFTFSEHNLNAQFSVPGVAVVGEFLVFGDIDGILYVYKKFREDNYQFIYSFKLKGNDPANLMCNWTISENGVENNSLWVISEVRPEKLSEANTDGNYWVLEGFYLEQEKANLIQQLNFRGVAPRNKKWPAIGTVRVGTDTLLALHLYPDTYLFSFLDSLHMFHLNAQAPAFYNYSLFSSDGHFYANSDEGKIVSVSLSEDTSAPLVENIRWQVPDSFHVVLRWDGIANALFSLVENNSGFQSCVSQPSLTFSIDEIPFHGQFKIKQDVGSVQSEWSEAVGVDVTSFPQIIQSDYYQNGFILLEFDQKVKYSGQSSYFTVDSGKVQSANQIADEKILLKYSLPERKRIVLEIRNVYSEQNIQFQTNELELEKEDIIWRPSVSVSRLGNDGFLLNFSGVFNESDLLNYDNYSLLPRGKIIGINLSAVNTVEINAEPLLALGYDYHLKISNISDINGLPIQHTSFLIPQPPVNGLENISLYPQPLSMNRNKELVIAGLPEKCEIKIFSASGRFVNQLSSGVNHQKLIWDLKNKWGDFVGSGVYLLVFRTENERKLKKIMLIR